MKKTNTQNLLLIFIILLPILDILSFIFRNFFNTTWSPSTFIRPIIPALVFLIIFFKNNFKIKTFFIALLYGFYVLIHLAIYQRLNNGFSYGSVFSELRYLINYTFNILTLFIFLFVFYKKDIYYLKKAIVISCTIYIFSIYLSIITKTYSTTYLEGTGIKGWFESGNSLSATLLLGLFILYSIFSNYKNKSFLLVIISITGIYLLLLMGTRTALFGFLIVTFLYILFELFNKIKNKIRINKKNIICIILIFLTILFVVFILGSKTLERRKYLSALNVATNVYTGETLHITSDLANIKYQAENNFLEENYMSKSEKQALYSLSDFANKYEISCTNRRIQELVYNIYLVKYQKNIISIIFGNGLLNNYGELVLEIEIPAFILNFGVLGFVLYFVPFLIFFIYSLYKGYKYKLFDTEYLMLLSGLLFSFASACFTGVTFFNTSSATFVTLIIVLLINRINTRKEMF